MAAKIVRLVQNFEQDGGKPNPQFRADRPAFYSEVLSVDSVPPRWSENTEADFVRFPSHAAADERCEQLRATGTKCFAVALPADPNQRPAFESLPPPPSQLPIFDAERQIAVPEKDCAGSFAASAARECGGGGKADCGVRTRPSRRRSKSERKDALRASHARVNGADKPAENTWWKQGQYA